MSIIASDQEYEYVDASEIGLAPGSWPPKITRNSRTYVRGEVHRDADGDITYVDYVTGLRVVND